jgi:glyoxylase-like metal-dependent hydrolase (beta-lactamase superfamily II)
MNRERFVAAVLALGAFACRNTATPPPEVHTYAAEARGIFANSYLVESDEGVVAIDAALTVSDATALRARLDALKKPLLAVLLTHGHPDHYNGAAILAEGTGSELIALASVDRVIRESDAAKEQQWRPMFGAEWPEKRAFPTRTVRDSETLELAGMRFTVHELGSGESHADSYWVLEDEDPKNVRAFVGDVVFNGVHSYLSDGHLDAWLATLDRMERELSSVETIYPGHGAAGGRELFAAQREYLQLYRATVAKLAAGASALDDAQKAELVRVMKEKLPTDRLEFLIALGADAVAANLR